MTPGSIVNKNIKKKLNFQIDDINLIFQRLSLKMKDMRARVVTAD